MFFDRSKKTNEMEKFSSSPSKETMKDAGKVMLIEKLLQKIVEVSLENEFHVGGNLNFQPF